MKAIRKHVAKFFLFNLYYSKSTQTPKNDYLQLITV